MAVLLLLAGFAIAEWFPLVIEFRKQGVHSTLSGLVIVLGVIFVGPIPTLVPRLVAGGLALALRWGMGPDKVRFNVATQAFEVWLLATVFALFAGAAPLLSPGAALGIVAAVVIAEAGVCGLVLTVIRVCVGPFQQDVLRSTGLAALITCAISAAGAVVGTRLLVVGMAEAVAFAGVLGLLIATNRSRHAMVGKLGSLTRLYGFMDRLQDPASMDGLLGTVLEQAQTVTGCGRARVVVVIDDVAQQFSLVSHDLVSSDAVDTRTARLLIADAHGGICVDEDEERPSTAILGPADGQLLVVPFGHDSVEGVLVLDGKGERLPKFDVDDRALAHALAGHVGVALASSRLVDKLRMRSYELQRSALHDPQTQMWTYDGLVAHASTLEMGTLVIADVVDLEMIDTAFGHGLSQDVISSIGDRLRLFAERHGFGVARLGVSRFALVMNGVDHRLDARAALTVLRDSLSGPLASTRLDLEARFALGAASAPEHGTDVAELLRRAASALLEDRQGALTNVAWFTPELDVAATNRLDLASDLRQALETDGLCLAYQPKVDLDTGLITGVEALARWAHPTRGYVSPADFVDIAERTGLIRPLTIWVADRAIRQASLWAAAGHDLSVAINLSTAVLDDPTVADWIIDCCRVHRVPGHRIIVEITESQMMGDVERGSGILAMLDAGGIRLSVDDFGTGYSSLAQLKGLPVDEVKIDRGFITDLASDVQDQALTRAIITMAHSLQLAVVAEGIEDDASMQILADQGCDTGQGFFLHRPMAAVAVTQRLDQQASRTAPDTVIAADFDRRRSG